MSSNPFSTIPEVFLPTGTIVGDTVKAPGGSSDSIPQLPKVGNTPISAAFAILSTTGAFKLPEFTTSQLNNLVTNNAMLAYNSNTGLLNYSSGGTWYPIDSSLGPGVFPKVSVGNGTAASPSITFQNDGTTGLFLSGVDALGIAAGGALQVGVTGPSNAVNFIVLEGAATGHDPAIGASGSDSNVSLDFVTLGTGSFKFLSETNPATIELFNLANTQSVKLRAPSGLGSTVTYTLPGTFSAGEYLTVDVSGNLSFVPVTNISTPLRSVYYSENGNDSTGDGTLDLPFATVTQATTYALTLSPTNANPINVIGDSGSYVATGLQLNPNINYSAIGGSGVTWTGSGNIVLANTFTSSAANIYISGINCQLALNLDASALSNFNCTITINEPFTSSGSPVFKNKTAGNYILNMNGAVSFTGTQATFDGITFNGYGSHTFGVAIGVTLLTTNAQLTFNSYGNAGIGSITATSSGSNAITSHIFAGSAVTFSTITNNGNNITLNRDSTTWTPTTTYAGTISSIVDLNLSVYNSIISQASSVTIQSAATYIANSGSLVTFTLPASIFVGQKFKIVGAGSGGWRIAQNSGQTIRLTSAIATTAGTGGSLSSSDRYDSVTLYSISSTELVVFSPYGNLTYV